MFSPFYVFVQAGEDQEGDAAKKTFEFWSKQPVPKMDEEVTTNEAIAEDIPLEKLRKEPYTLPEGFAWDTLNLNDPLVVRKDSIAVNITL